VGADDGDSRPLPDAAGAAVLRSLRAWLLRAAGTFAPARREREFAEELDSHLQLHVDDNIRAGMSPDDARRDAIVRLGGLTQARERQRDRIGLQFADALRRDVAYAVRSLHKNPAFALTAVLTIALGIGANSAIFSVVNAVLLRPLPFEDPGRLVMIFATEASRNDRYDVATYPDYADWNNQNRSFASMTAYTNRSTTVSVAGEAVLVQGKRVTPNFFDVLGVRPALGRAFRPEEQAPGASRVVVISDGFWKRHYAGNADVLGQTLQVNDEPYTIVGVMPPAFHVDAAEREQFFAPLPIDPSRGHGFLRVVGRLKPGVTVPQAQDDLAAIARHTSAHCKLSGLVTEAGARWNVQTLRRYVEHVLECFGSARVMWGSDWPVMTLAASYAAWSTATDELLTGLAAEERDAIRGGNAVRFYGLETRASGGPRETR
jgi:hypothetical protein